MITAKVIADSITNSGNRITTMVVTMPRIILAEFNTHRMFSRNSASSRAIPLLKMVESVRTNPFIPIAWQKEHTGMQGTEYHNEEDSKLLNTEWLIAKEEALSRAGRLFDKKATKQLCNRLLEPFMYHTVIVTATEWENFFALRCPKYSFLNSAGFKETRRSRKQVIHWKMVVDKVNRDVIEQLEAASDLDWLKQNEGQAEIHMMQLAEKMYDAYGESVPEKLYADEWHIPFGKTITNDKLWDEITENQSPTKLKTEQYKVKIATAMCARVSYTVIGEEGKEPNYNNDIKLHDKLALSGHWSPFEHCARVIGNSEYDRLHSKNGWSGNFKGFIQYRKLFKNENITNESK